MSFGAPPPPPPGVPPAEFPRAGSGPPAGGVPGAPYPPPGPYPPAGGYPPGAYPPASPPPRPRRTLRTVLLVVAVVGVLCVGGLGTGGFFLVRTVLGATEPVREVTHAFIGDLQAGEYDRAYDRLCTPNRAVYTRDDFARLAQQRADVVDYRITGVNIANRNGVSTGSVRTRLDLADGSSVNHEFPLVKEGDEWLVCGNPF